MVLAALALAVGVAFVVSRAGTATAAAPRLTAIEIVDGVLFNDRGAHPAASADLPD